MTILNRTEFMALPEGVLYSKYEPCYFTDLLVKGQSLQHDFVCLNLIGNIQCEGSCDFEEKLQACAKDKTSIDLDFDNYGRDGMFDKDQLFAVYELKDLLELQLTLCKSIEALL